MFFRRKKHTKQLEQEIKHGSWHSFGTNFVLWLESQRISSREMQSRTRMLTDPTRYNLAICFMENSMLSSSIHFHCTMFIVDWLNLALPLERIQVRVVTLCYRCWQRSTQNHGSVWQPEYVTGEITCCTSSALSLTRAAMSNCYDFRLCLFWVVLQRLFLASAFWKAILLDCFEVHLVSVKMLSLLMIKQRWVDLNCW